MKSHPSTENSLSSQIALATKKLGLVFRIALAVAAVFAIYHSAQAANTEKDVVNGQSDLFLGGTYNPSGVPTVTSDVTFTNVAYSPAAFTLSGNITVGSLNDSRNGTNLSISNTSGSAKTITLGGAGDLGNSVSGAAADLLFVANGGNLTLTGGSGTTALNIALGQTGNFDVQGNGALGISSIISDGGSGFGLTKTGSGTLSLNNLTANTYTGATTIAQGMLYLSFFNNSGNATSFISSSSALVMGGNTFNSTGALVSGTSGGGTINAGSPTLFVQGNNGSARTQTFNGFTANAGTNQILVQAVNANVTLALGALSRTAGGTVNFSRDNNGASAPIITTSSSNDASGILGGWAVTNGTVANSGSVQVPTDYAANDGSGNIIAYTGYDTSLTSGGTIASDGTKNYKVTPAATMSLSTADATTTDVNTFMVGSTTGAFGTTITVGAAGTGSTGILRMGANGGFFTASTNGNALLTIGNTANNGTLTAGGAANTAGEINLQTNQRIDVNSAIKDNGTGKVTLTINAYSTPNSNTSVNLYGTNTYSGGTFINSGRVLGNTGSAFGTGAVTIATGAQAFLQNVTYANDFNISGYGFGTGGFDTPVAIRLGGTLTGKITLLSDAYIGGGSGTLSGQITGGYGLYWGRQFGGNGAGTGTITLSNIGTASNYTGNTTITEGTVKLGASDQIPDGASAGNLVFNNAAGGGTFDLNGFSDTINGLTGVSNSTVKNGVAGTSVLTIGANNATATYAGTISNTTGTLGIIKTGTGTQTLAGTNSYGGVTTVNGGTLQITTSLTGTGAVNVNGGGTLNTAGTAISLGGATTVAGGSSSPTQGTITMIGNTLATDVLTLGNAGGLTIGGTSGNSSNLGFDVLFSGGSALADKISITNALTVNAGGANILINGLGGFASGQTYTLLNYGSGTGAGFATGTGTTVGGFTLANTSLSFGVTGALNVTGTALQLVTSGAAAPATAYFSGAQGTTWNATNLGQTAGNFTTDQAGTSFVQAYPASTTDVIYVADNATNFANSTLGANFDIKSLTFRGTGPTATTVSNITGSNRLSLEAGGITLAAGNAGATLGMTGIGLGTSQTWTNNSSNALTISSTAAITSNATSGTTTLTLGNTGTGTTTINGTIGNGTGSNTVAVVINNSGTGNGATTTFAGTNTYSGGTTVTAGTVSLTNASGFGTGTVAVGASGTVTIGLNATIGNVFTGTGIVTVNATSGATQFTSATAFNGFAGTLNVNSSGGSKMALTAAGQTIGSGATVNVANGATLFVANSSTFSGVTFNVNGGGNGENLGALRFEGTTIAASSAVNLLSDSAIGGNGNSIINAVIAGTGFGLSKAGGATLTLGGANTFSGTTTINAGTLNLSNALALQNSTLNYTGNTLVFDQSVAGNAFTFGGLSGNANIALLNNAGTPAPISLTVGGNNASTVYSGVLSGTGSNFTKTGTGTFELDTAATLTGNFTIGNGILSLVNNVNTITAGPVIFGTAGAANNTAMTFSQVGRTFTSAISTQGTGGTNTLQSQGGGQTFTFTGGFTLGNNLTLSTFGGSDGITVQTGAIGGTGNLVTNVTTISAGGGGGPAGTIGASGGNITINSGVNNVGTVTNSGNGSASVLISGVIGTNVTGVIQSSTNSPLTLSGSNTYIGATTVNAGTLKAGVASVANVSGAFGNNSAVTMANVSGATLDITGFNTQIGSLTGGGATGGNVTLGGATLTTGGDNTSPAAYAGVISGAGGSLTKIGTGTQTLSGSNTYGGPTNVNGGILEVSAGGSLNSNVNVNNTGSFGGGGTINGNITVSAGGTLAPGDPKTTTVNGNVTISNNGTADFAIAASRTPNSAQTPNGPVTPGNAAGTTGDYDQVHLTGTPTLTIGNTLTTLKLDLSAALLSANSYLATNAVGTNQSLDNYFVFNLDGTNAISGRFTTLTITGVNAGTGTISYDTSGNTNPLAGGDRFQSANIGDVIVGSQEYAISYVGDYLSNSTGGGNDLVVTAIPEPSTYAMILSGFGMLIGFQKFRTKRRLNS